MCLYLASVNQWHYFSVHTSHSQCVLSTWEQNQIFFFILVSKYGK